MCEKNSKFLKLLLLLLFIFLLGSRCVEHGKNFSLATYSRSIMLIMYFIWLSSCGPLSSKHNGLFSLRFFSTLSTKIGQQKSFNATSDVWKFG